MDFYDDESLYMTLQDARRLNIALDYQVIMLLTRAGLYVILPYEIRPLDSDSERFLGKLPEIAKQLLAVILRHFDLEKLASYLLDVYWRLEEGDVEGSRASVRKALESLLKNIVPRLKVPEEPEREREVKRYSEKLKRLIKALQDLASPGGPHLGPAPKATTEMLLEATVAIIKGLDKALNQGILELSQA